MSTNGAASCKFDQLSVEELQEILISNEQKLQALAEEIRTKNEQIDSYKIEVEWLKMQLVKLRRMQFGQKSEKIGKEIEQIELLLEDIEATQSQHAAADEKKQEKSPRSPAKPRMPRVFPANLPRERRVLAPTHEACPDCGGAFTHLGETVSETLDIEPIHFKVIQYVRPSLLVRSAMSFCKSRQRLVLSSGVFLSRDCLRTCLSENISIICRSIVNRKHFLAKALTLIAASSLIGSDLPQLYSRL